MIREVLSLDRLRSMTAEEAAAFLLSDSASFINGEILHVDGGIAAAG